jgi:acyl-coenzyme A thioesterase 13
MVDSPALCFPRSLPRAPNFDISHIKGNVTDEQKQLEVNVLFYFISTREKSYGADIGQRLKVMEMNVWNKDGAAAYGEIIFEIKVQKG